MVSLRIAGVVSIVWDFIFWLILYLSFDEEVLLLLIGLELEFVEVIYKLIVDYDVGKIYIKF